MKQFLGFFSAHGLFLLGFLPLIALNLFFTRGLLALIFTHYYKTLQDIFPGYDEAKLKKVSSISGFRKWSKIIFNREIASLSRGDRELSNRYLFFYLTFFLIVGYTVFLLIRIFTWQDNSLPY
ncbi:MAG: hypothetical protein A2Y33_03970 [Spirochaetes bacterium GWF1_51_8]|nr:MAG: hypothetical protein A2Y33_03970 [Spirochaetes bacterium GWF1_51_8]